MPAPGMLAVALPPWSDGITSQTACARTREGSGFPFPPGPGPRGVKVSQLAPLLSIRLSEGSSRATWSSPRAFLSVGDGMLPILRRVSESAWAEAARLPGQAWRDNRLAAEAVPLTRIAWAVPPGQWVPQSWSESKCRPRLSSHKFHSHGNVQAQRRG